MVTLAELEIALKGYQKVNDRTREADTLAQMGNVYRQQGKWPRAVDAYKKSLEIFIELNNPAHQASVHAYLGSVYWEQGRVNKTIVWFGKGLQILNEIGDLEGKRMVAAILGLSFWRKGDWDRSIDLLKEVLPIRIESIPKPYHLLYELIGKAIPVMENRIRASQSNNNFLREMQAHLTLVPLTLCMEQKNKASSHLESAESLARRLKQEHVLKVLPHLRQLIG